MKIQLLHTKDCHAWQEAEKVLREALTKAGLPADFDVVLVTEQKQAEKLHFLGSPQITINGEDIDPLAKNATRFSIQSCRPYYYKGKSFDWPPKEMILERLKDAKFP